MTMTSQIERPGAITFKGGPMTLVGQELKVGDKIPRVPCSDGGQTRNRRLERIEREWHQSRLDDPGPIH